MVRSLCTVRASEAHKIQTFPTHTHTISQGRLRGNIRGHCEGEGERSRGLYGRNQLLFARCIIGEVNEITEKRATRRKRAAIMSGFIGDIKYCAFRFEMLNVYDGAGNKNGGKC